MNYYERHLGDYARDTGHLSLVEHGVYTLLIDRYYASEAPIPEADAYRVARARSKDERAAVDAVLAEFFSLEDGAYHQKRIDAEIERYLAKEPEREKKKADAAARQRRARERRVELFEQLRQHGIVPSIKTPTHELETMLVSRESRDGHAYVTRDNTLTQSPVTSHQSPIKNPVASESVIPGGGTLGGAVCARLMKLGIQGVNPQHPKLLALLSAGLTGDEIVAAGEDGAAKGKGFAWILATAEGRRRDAATVDKLPIKAEKPWFLTASGIESKGDELGLTKGRDELFPNYKLRVFAAANVTDEMLRKANIDFGGRQ